MFHANINPVQNVPTNWVKKGVARMGVNHTSLIKIAHCYKDIRMNSVHS